jgi:hypothetical protein
MLLVFIYTRVLHKYLLYNPIFSAHKKVNPLYGTNSYSILIIYVLSLGAVYDTPLCFVVL